MSWSIRIGVTAREQLRGIGDLRIRKGIAKRIDGLREDPDKQGKPLLGEISGCRSLRAVGQRCRIIYRVMPDNTVVVVAALGIRKQGDKRDIYELARKIVRLGLLEEGE